MAPAPEPTPTAELAAWIAAHGGRPESLVALTGDVSPRRYHRLAGSAGSSLILAAYPGELLAACRRFLATGRLLADAGVVVPEVLASDCDRGWMLLEDLGAETLYDRRDRGWEELIPHLAGAVELAGRIARLEAEKVAALSPPLDRELLARELAQTWEVFLEPRGLTGEGAFRNDLEAAFATLCTHLGAGPQLPCHRDFMARNLVPRADGAPPAVLDHQDLRLGPELYDLASLCNDSLYPPAELEARLLAPALGAGELPAAYHRAAAQRTLKAVGTFAAFARRGYDRHLELVPATLRRALGHLARLPESAALAPELARLWRPVLR